MSAKHEKAIVVRRYDSFTPLKDAALQAGMPALQSRDVPVAWRPSSDPLFAGQRTPVLILLLCYKSIFVSIQEHFIKNGR